VALTWKPQGPRPTTGGQVEGIVDREVVGAIKAVAPHPTDPDIVYVGSVNGGVWRTRNARSARPKWEHLTDHLPSRSIGALQFDPTASAHTTLVAGTGRFSSLNRIGGALVGVLRTTDGGGTWTQHDAAGQSRAFHICDVAPRGRTIVIAANNAGIFRTTDAGISWAPVTGAGGTGLPPGVSFALAGDPIRPTQLYAHVGTAGIFKSTDIGGTWTKVSTAAMDGLLGPAVNVKIATGRNYNVYVAIASGPQGLTGLFHSDPAIVSSKKWPFLNHDESTAGGLSQVFMDGAVTTDRPRVSAVITTYDVADHIPELSRRLAEMPMVDEIVIYDDASSDRTPELLEKWATRDPRIALMLGSRNQGVAVARNEALAHCHGEFVWFADPDDRWSPRLVEVLYQALMGTGADIAVCRADQRPVDCQQTSVIDGLDRWATRDRAATIESVLTGAMHGYLWNKLVRRSIMPTAPFPPMRSQSDFLGLIATLARCRSTVFVPQVLYTRVERPGSITRRAEDQIENLRRCAAAVELLLAEEGRLEQYAEALQYFKVWFFAIPAVNTPLRTGATPELVRSGIHSALDVVTELPMRNHVRIATAAPRLESQVISLLVLRGAYPTAYRAAKAIRALTRATKR
jgi:hypothetical protein